MNRRHQSRYRQEDKLKNDVSLSLNITYFAQAFDLSVQKITFSKLISNSEPEAFSGQTQHTYVLISKHKKQIYKRIQKICLQYFLVIL